MAEEDNRERISSRHGGNEEVVTSLMGIGQKLYEPVTEDEEGVVSIEIGKAATKEENVSMILDKCHAYKALLRIRQTKSRWGLKRKGNKGNAYRFAR